MNYLSTDAAARLAGRRVLVTGATGFIGQHLVRQGVAAGLEVHAIGRRPGPEGSVYHQADLNQADRLAAIVAKVAPDVLINLASPGVAHGTAAFDEILTALVTGTNALLTACATLPARPVVVHAGSSLEYANQERPIREDDPIVPSGSRYGSAKAVSSAIVGSFAGELSVTLLRPFNIYGAGDVAPRLGSFLLDAARGIGSIDVTASAQVRDFLHVDDCANCFWTAAASALSAPGITVLNVGSGEPRPLRDYIQGIAEVLAEAGLPLDVRFGARPYRPGEPMLNVPDLTRVYQVLDWRPQIGFSEGLADYVRWSLAR